MPKREFRAIFGQQPSFKLQLSLAFVEGDGSVLDFPGDDSDYSNDDSSDDSA